MLFIASFFATPVGVAQAHADSSCQSIALAVHANAAHAADNSDNTWLPVSHEVRVRAYGSLRARDVASVRVLGRCVVKAAPENAQPVLYVPFASQLDNSDDEDLASARPEIKPQFGLTAALGIGPANLVAPCASVGQLERPPRV